MTTLDRSGRILLPAELRRRLNLRPGARLQLEVVAERIQLSVEPDPAPALATSPSRRRVLPASGQPSDAAAATRAERAAQSVRRGG